MDDNKDSQGHFKHDVVFVAHRSATVHFWTRIATYASRAEATEEFTLPQ